MIPSFNICLLVKQGVLYLNLFLKNKLLSSSKVTRYEHEKPDEERGNIMAKGVYPNRRNRVRLNLGIQNIVTSSS